VGSGYQEGSRLVGDPASPVFGSARRTAGRNVHCRRVRRTHSSAANREASSAGRLLCPPGAPAGFLLEDGPDVRGVVDNAQPQCGRRGQVPAHRPRRRVPAAARQLPVEMGPDADQRCAVRRCALRHSAEGQPRFRRVAEQCREELARRDRAIQWCMDHRARAEQANFVGCPLLPPVGRF
jgi:hypothetical protein